MGSLSDCSICSGLNIIELLKRPRTRVSWAYKQQMAKSWSSMAIFSIGLAIMSLMMFYVTTAQPYDGQMGGLESASDYDYAEDNFRDLLQQLPHTQKKRVFFPNDYVKRRLCIAPQMSCSTMPNSCCSGNVCRCNLWGQNCRCLRMGFFQRWGK